jgi:non-ribosomal peptide synthetase component F
MDLLTHELVGEMARAHPNRPAVAGLEYRRLFGRATALAGLLAERGAGPDVVVALCLPRGPDLVTAALGVLLAGAAYLPLDPDQPADRLLALLTSVGGPLLISTADGGGRRPGPGDPAGPPRPGPCRHSAPATGSAG